MLNHESLQMMKAKRTEGSFVARFWPVLEWAALLAAIFLFTITEAYQTFVTAGVGLLAVSMLARFIRTRRWLPHTGLELPAALFIASAALAARIAYQPSAASLQLVRILALFVLFYAIIESQSDWQRWLAGGLLLAAAFLAIYWPVQNDFLTQPGKLAVITELGLRINRLAASLPPLPGPTIHSNVAAGVLALALPFGAALTVDLWKHSKRLLAGLAGLLTLVVLAGLFLTSSRGAWLAVLATAAFAVLVGLQRRFFFTPRQRLLFWGVVTALGLAVLAVAWRTPVFDKLAGSVPGPNGGSQPRLELWEQGVDLVRDHLFTGTGLMAYWMTHATYRLLVHTPIIAHSHNSFLQVWVEQGLLGIVALLWGLVILLTWAWRALSRPAVPALGWGGLAAFSVVSLHGLVDVVFYVERTLPLLGLVLGFTRLAAGQASARDRRAYNLAAITTAAVMALAVLLVLMVPAVKAAWYANLGAVLQARSELPAYNPDRFDEVSLDQVRRQADLRPAEDAFHKALAIDPANRTSLQRLAEISLSRGRYDEGLEYAERLWQAGWRDEVTRMLYGDALVANQKPAQAASMVKDLAWGKMRLLGQAWYRYWVHQDYQRAADAWQAVLLLDPQAQDIDYWLEQALSRLEP